MAGPSSAIARFQKRMRYATERAVLEDLFGIANATALLDLPRQIDAVLQRLPPGHPHSSAEIIRDHTTVLYNRCFVPVERATRAESVVRGERPGHVPHPRIAGTAALRRPGSTLLSRSGYCRETATVVHVTARFGSAPSTPPDSGSMPRGLP